MRGNKRGFTLVEVMISMILLALVASGIFSILISARYLVNRSKKRTLGIIAAQSYADGLYDNVRADFWDCTTVAANPLAPCATWISLPNPYPGYSMRYRVDPVAGLTSRKVTIEVRWNDTQV